MPQLENGAMQNAVVIARQILRALRVLPCFGTGVSRGVKMINTNQDELLHSKLIVV